MRETENLNLQQFEGMDKFDYNVINENWKKIDRGVVLTTRNINGKELSEDVSLLPIDLGMLTKLWAGSWNSGSITIPDWKKYNIFTIVMEGAASPVLVIRYGSKLRGIGGNITDGGVWTMSADFTINDDSWEYGCVGFVSHTPNGNHSALTSKAAVIGIWGLC